MKKLLFFLLVCVLITGCTGLIVKRGTVPYERGEFLEKIEEYPPEIKELPPEVKESPVEVEESPVEIEKTEEIHPERVEVISEIPPGEYKKLKLGVVPVHPVDKNTVLRLQEEMGKTGEVIFVNKKPLIIEAQGGNGKWYTGWVEPLTIFLAKEEISPDGKREYQLGRIALCWNPIKGTKILIHPLTRIVNIKERYRTTERYRTVERYRTIEQYRSVERHRKVERYRDIDYTPAIWSFVGGVAVGIGVGYLIFPQKEVIRILHHPSVITR